MAAGSYHCVRDPWRLYFGNSDHGGLQCSRGINRSAVLFFSEKKLGVLCGAGGRAVLSECNHTV